MDFSPFLGSWSGENALYLHGPDGPVNHSATTLCADLIAGNFLHITYEWSHEDKPYNGVLLVNTTGTELTWADSFHQDTTFMHLSGEGLVFHGSFSVPEGPDWGWIIRLAANPDTLQLHMDIVDPAGNPYPGVRADYTKDTP